MPRRKKTDAPVRILLHIPSSVDAELRLLLSDPFTQQLKYGALSDLITQLLREWLDQQKKRARATAEAQMELDTSGGNG